MARVPAEIGGYRLLEVLGAGGMGSVYLGEHLQTRARRALKLLPLSARPDLVARFRREGEAQAAVGSHPNVARVFSAGEEAGHLFLVMEYVEGSDLAKRLRRGPLEPAAAARIIAAVARGLEHAHQSGVLHRDLKPANVVLALDGTPKLVDFGLARVEGSGSLTQSGTLLGTPSYMAPEQAKGQRADVDVRTDVYGLGALLYHALSGRPPFAAGSTIALLAKIVRDPPEPLHVAPALAAVCQRALRKQSADRYPSAAAFALALESWEQEAAPRPRLATFGALAIFAAGALLLAALAGPRRAAPATRPQPVASPAAAKPKPKLPKRKPPKPPKRANPESGLYVVVAPNGRVLGGDLEHVRQDGGLVQTWARRDSANQLWWIERLPGGGHQITLADGGLALDAGPAGTPPDGVQLWTPMRSERRQTWNLLQSDRHIRFVPRAEPALSLRGPPSVDSGVGLSATGPASDLWLLRRAPQTPRPPRAGHYRIVSAHDPELVVATVEARSGSLRLALRPISAGGSNWDLRKSLATLGLSAFTLVSEEGLTLDASNKNPLQAMDGSPSQWWNVIIEESGYARITSGTRHVMLTFQAGEVRYVLPEPRAVGQLWKLVSID